VLVETQVRRTARIIAPLLFPRMQGGAAREHHSNSKNTFFSKDARRKERRTIMPCSSMSKTAAARHGHGHKPLCISIPIQKTGPLCIRKRSFVYEPIYSTSTPVSRVIDAHPSHSANAADADADADSLLVPCLLTGMSSSSGSSLQHMGVRSKKRITQDYNNDTERIINISAAAVNRGCASASAAVNRSAGREQQKRHYYSLGRDGAPSLFLSSGPTRCVSSHSFLSSFHNSTSTLRVMLAQRREFSSSKADLLVNEQICFPRLRVVDVRGFVGDFDLHDALKLSRDKGTDLVLIDAKVIPPLARLTNAEEYAQELAEKEKRRLMMATPSDKGYSFDPALKVKGMRISATADPDDVERKLRRIIEFLEKGHRVDVTLMGGSKSPWYRGEGEFRMPKFVPKNQLKRSPMHPVALLAKRVIGDTKELAKIGPYHRGAKAGILKLWPCTPEQAARSKMPTNEELEELYGGYSQDAHQVDDDFFQFKKREKARQIEEFGVRKEGVRKENRKSMKEEEED